ncbi:MAG: cytochrome c biogenesis protein CcsA [Phycisphaeraceae bacterium]|nr:cytochrome c biogenesis protein CcsA [Phycisphaeraceae bacterium]
MKTLVRVLGVIALAAVSHGGLRAWAQPAGNEHPQTAMLSSEGKANPFGAPSTGPAMTIDAKRDFAAKVDLSPLRDLGVYHNGRIKILDTLARETVSTIANRKDYYDIRPDPQNPDKATRVKYDPLFTFLDLIIDPAYYHDKPLLGVNYLPLREELISREYSAREQVEYWKRVARVSPRIIERHIQAVAGGQNLAEPFRKALSDLNEAMGLYLGSAGNLMMVASDAPDKPWSHLSTLAPEHPVSKATARLGSAWRAGDAEGVNGAVRTLAEELPKINGAMYPTTRRTLERVYNASNAFEWGMWLYAGSLVSLLLAFGTGRRWLRVAGVGLLSGAVAMHLLGFGLRCIIAERYSIQNQFESMTGVSLFAAIVGIVLALGRRQLIFATAAAGVGFLILVTATQTGIPGSTIQREAAILNTSVLLKYHVTIVLFSYGLISLGFITSLFYLLAHYFRQSGATVALAGEALGAGAAVASGGKARVLADLDRAQMTILQLAFWTLGVGILLGAWWADHSWGRWWAFDPKELWALVTWIVYLIVIHVRLAGIKDRGLTTAWLSIVGFFTMLWCYFGVNLLLPGLHAYA